MPVKLKMCGIRDLAAARYCAGAGADYLGFIQYEGSPRYVEPVQAREIIAWIHGPEAVGVFVNTDPVVVNRIAGDVGFSLVQLHGDETPEECRRVERPVIKTLHVDDTTTPDDLRAQMERYAGAADYFLLDTRKAGLWGGTGETFDWRVVEDLAASTSLFLSGGIGVVNVAEAIRRVHPFAVDLSSSVESSPGVKDVDKLAAFFDTYHAALTSLETDA